MEESKRQSIDAEKLCKLIRDNPGLVQMINEAIDFDRRSAAAERQPAPQPAIDPEETDEPKESNLKMLHAINTSPTCQRQSPSMILVRGAEKACLNESHFVSPTHQYAQLELNNPIMLPHRGEGPAGFIRDAPCTEMGLVTSRLLGRSIRESSHNIKTVFTSPALDCLQTANEIRNQQPNSADIKIKVEPGLFDHTGWFKDYTFPSFLSPEGANAGMLGCNVDRNYQPLCSLDDLRLKCEEQSPAATYERIQTTVQTIRQMHPDETIVCVGHATTMDAVIRELRQPGADSPSPTHLRQLGRAYPHCAAVEIKGAWEESNGGDIPIEREQRLLPIHTASSNNRVDWNFVAEAQRPRAETGE